MYYLILDITYNVLYNMYYLMLLTI